MAKDQRLDAAVARQAVRQVDQRFAVLLSILGKDPRRRFQAATLVLIGAVTQEQGLPNGVRSTSRRVPRHSENTGLQ